MAARYRTLDAMRGVAALSVVLMHSWPLAVARLDAWSWVVPHGYLAVDMFFVLSGFVIAHSYDRRLSEGLGVLRFMRLRVIRLFPIFWLAAIIGAVPLLWAAARDIEPFAIALPILAFNGLILPAPTFGHHVDPFPLNSPAWSLFFELWVANLIYGALWPWLRGKWLVALIAVAFIGLCFGAYIHGTLNGGALWSNFDLGFPRVMFSFFVGVLLSRHHEKTRTWSVPAILILAVLELSFWLRPPVIGVAYDVLCAAVLYPALVFFGASAQERHPRWGTMLGDASYAIYLVHVPILLLIMQLRPTPSAWLAAGFIIGSLLLALLIDAVFDKPARAMLGRLLKLR